MNEREASRLYYLADLVVSDPAHAVDLVDRARSKASATESEPPPYREALRTLSKALAGIAWSSLDPDTARERFEDIAERLFQAKQETSKDVGQALRWALRTRQHRVERGASPFLGEAARAGATQLPETLEKAGEIDLLKGVF